MKGSPNIAGERVKERSKQTARTSMHEQPLCRPEDGLRAESPHHLRLFKSDANPFGFTRIADEIVVLMTNKQSFEQVSLQTKPHFV